MTAETLAVVPAEAEVIQLRPACTTCGGPVGTTGLPVCTRHVRDELGISYRQLDYAVRAGYLKPERHWKGRSWGSGSPRVWPEEEIRVARLMGRLITAGLSLETAHAIARSGESRRELAPGVWIEVTA